MLIYLSQNANCSTGSVTENGMDNPIFYRTNVSNKVEAEVEKKFFESSRLAKSKAFKKRLLKTRQ